MAERIVVVPHDADWARAFETESTRLKRILAPWLEGGIHHIGSTAVPGLSAKPIVDMMAGVHDLAEAREALGPLGEHSYLLDPHRPGIAHHCVKPSRSLSEMTHALHLTEPGSDLWRERLAFRDALRDDPGLVREYESLKLRLAREYKDDPASYTAGKRDFVTRVLASAGLPLGRR